MTSATAMKLCHVPRSWVLGIALALVLGAAAMAGAWWFWPHPDPDVLWNQAEADLRADRIDAAASALRKNLLDSTSPGLRLDAPGQIAMARDRSDEAIADLGRIPDPSSFAAHARMMAGQIELRRDRVRSAEGLLRDAVRLNPELVQAHRELVYIYGMQSRRRALAEQFGVLSELEPLTFQHVFLWCLTRGTVWESSEIVDHMTRYLKADPEDVWSRLALADALENMGRLDDAEKALAPLADSNPDAQAAKARLAIDRGDMAAAEKLLAEGPEDHPQLARLRGKLDLRRRDAEAALRHFRTSDAAEPYNRDTIFGIAQALRLAGKTDEAAPYVKLAHDHDTITPLDAIRGDE